MKKIIETTKASITTLEDKQKTQKSSLEICKQEIQEKHEAHKKAEQAIKDNDIKISEQRIKVQKKQSVFNFNTTELKELKISLSASEKSKVEQETQKEEKIKSKNELKTKIETEEKSISNSKEKISKILKKISYA